MSDFDEEPDLGVFVSVPVQVQREPVRGVVHEQDGDWILSCGTVDAEDLDSWVLLHIHHVLDWDATVRLLSDLPPGWCAWRDSPADQWEREPLSDRA